MGDIFDEIDQAVAPEPAPPVDPQPAPAPQPDVFDAIDAAPTPQQRMAAAAAVAQPIAPDQAAKAATLATRAGVSPQAVLPVQKDASQVAAQAVDAAHYDDIVARHPVLARWLSEPTNAAIARGDLGNLRGLSTAVQALNPPVDDRPDLPLLGAFKTGVYKAVGSFNRTLLAGPAWLQQEGRSLVGITSTPNPNTPLGLLYGAHDMASSIQRERDAYFQPSATRDLISGASGMLADPTTALLLPAEGASLAIRGTQVLGEAAQAAKAIQGAAAVQAVVATGQTGVDQAVRRQQSQQQGQQIADGANALVQGALAYFFGKLGQEVPIQRALRTSPFDANPGRALVGDILRQATAGGSQAVAGGIADPAIHGEVLPTAGDLASLYASGAIPGALLAAGNAHEALIAAKHLDVIRHGEGLSFANKFADVVAAAQAAKAAQHGPEQVAALIDQMAASSGVSHVYLQAGEWQDHFLAKGLDPVAEAQRAGLSDEYIQARGLGGDMQIPLRTAVGLAVESDEPAALAAKVRQHALAPNGIEAAGFFAVPDQDAVANAKGLAAEQIASAQDVEKPPTIAQQIEAQAIAAGRSPEEARTAGEFHQRFFERLADHFNAAREEQGGAAVTAEQLANEFRVRVQRVLPDLLREQIASGRLPALLDQLRSQGPTEPLHHAARDALARLGFDPTQHTNDQILAALAERAQRPAVSTTVDGHPVVMADVPYGAGTSTDGRTVYIDHRIPRYLDIGGKRVDAHEAIARHELHEKPLMDAGQAYGDAHRAAQGHEHVHVAATYGVEQAEYEAALKPYIDAAKAQAKPEGIPRDLEPKPYRDMGEAHLIEGAKAPAFAAAPAEASAPTMQQTALGQFGHDAQGAIIRLFDGANKSTLFHESAHYFLDVLASLSGRDGAPKALVDDFNGLIAWAGYGDRATMERMQAELADLQAKPDPTDAERARMKELAEPHERVARGFEQYLMEGKAPAPGLRRAFARLKTWLTSLYQDVKNLGVNLTPEVRSIFDRLLASDREIERAKVRAGEAPAFADQASSGMSAREWKAYQAANDDAKRQSSDALERVLMEHERAAQSEAFASDRAEVRARTEQQVKRERVHDAIGQLQKGETWDGRDLAEPLKLARKDVDRLLTPAERKLLPGPGRDKNRGKSILTGEDHGVTADEAALRLGYGHNGGLDLLRDLIAAPDREQEIDRRTDAEMAQRYPDAMRNQPVLDKAADQALHAPDARSTVMEMERAALARLLAGERAKARDDAQRQDLAASRSAADAALGKQAGKIADALGKQAIRQATGRDERQAMRVAAQAMLRQGKVLAVDPDRFVAAERKAAIAAAEALGKKDYETALKQKRAQMMNAELARAAHAEADAIERMRRDLVKSGTDDKHRARIAKAGGLEYTVTNPDGTTKVFEGPTAQEDARAAAQESRGTFDRTSGYLEQVDALLERYDLKERSAMSLANRQTLRAFLDKIQGITTPDGERLPSGAFADIPSHVIDDLRRTNLAEMTVQDLHDLHAAVRGIESLAKQVNSLMGDTRAERLADLATSVAEQVRATGKKRLPKLIGNALASVMAGDDGTTGGLLTKPLRAIGNFFNDLMTVPRLCYEMDGFKEGGPVAKAILFPAIQASDRELLMKAEARAKVDAAAKEWGKSDGYRRETIDGLTKPDGSPWRMTRLDRIVTLMHYGNVEGRQRLLDLNRWGDREVHLVVDGLDAKDISFANAMVDVLSAHWSEVKALEEKYNGVAPPKVEAIPVDLPNGSYKGGYQRIYYDGESASKLEHMAQQMRDEGMIGAGYRRPTTAHGATKARSAVVKDRVLSLDSGNWARALNETIHDLTHRDVVHDQMRLLNHPEVRDAMIERWGLGTWKTFLNQTVGLAQGNKPAVTSAERVAEYLRLCSNYSRRAFNPAYALIQEAGLPLAAQRVKPQYLAAAQAQIWSGPLAIDHTSHWIAEQSPTMKYRSRTRDALIGDAMNETSLSGSARKFMDGAGMLMVLKTWEHMDNVVWKGAYDQHRSETGADHAEAVLVANQVVESVMGSNKQKDLPQVMRAGGPAVKVFTSNMSWALANWNNIATEWNRTAGGLRRYGQGGYGQMARGLAGLATLCVAGPMLWDWLSDLTKGNDMASWTEGSGLVKHAATALPYSLASGIPILRDIEPAMVEGRDDHGGTVGLGWLKAIQHLGAALHAKHYGEPTAKAAAGAIGSFLPLPSAALFNAIDGYKQAQRHGDGLPGIVWQMANGPTPKRK